MGKRVIVVGGDAAGMSAASQARRVNPGLEVTVFERGPYISYGACGMPYYIAGDIASYEELLALTPAAAADRGIDVRTSHEVTAVRPAARSVTVRDGAGAVRQERYDQLVLATGGEAVVPPWPGADVQGVLRLRGLGDGIAVRTYVEQFRPRCAAIIGTGFVGVEMAEALLRLGLQVTMIGRSARLLSHDDPDFVRPVTDTLREHGLELALGQQVEAIVGKGSHVRAVVTDAAEHPADIVMVAVGVRPAVGLAAAAGIALGGTGAVAVDERMKTSAPGVYAAGDCVEVTHVVTGARAYSPLALTANRTGRIAGDNLAAESLGRTSSQRFRGTANTLVTKVFELTVAQTGLTPAEADAAGYAAATFTREAHSRARYYPGGSELHTRIVVDRHTRRLLGAQMLGREGVAGRIDVFATALFNRMTVDEVYDLELAYAPPYGPVYDPVIEICGRAGMEL